MFQAAAKKVSKAPFRTLRSSPRRGYPSIPLIPLAPSLIALAFGGFGRFFLAIPDFGGPELV